MDKIIVWSNRCNMIIGGWHCYLCDFCKKECIKIIDNRDLEEPVYIIACSKFNCKDEYKFLQWNQESLKIPIINRESAKRLFEYWQKNKNAS